MNILIIVVNFVIISTYRNLLVYFNLFYVYFLGISCFIIASMFSACMANDIIIKVILSM